MNLTAQLLRVFLVDKQLTGLQSRLRSAEAFLGEQERLLAQFTAQKSDLELKIKQARAAAATAEGEIASIDARSATLREQMNNAKTNKEYKAFLTELNTYKVDRDKLETTALEHMGKVDELRKKIEELDAQVTERTKLRGVADEERGKRSAEIRDRVAELQSQRVDLAGQLPTETLKNYERLRRDRGDEAMAPLEEHDRKRLEYTCGSCMMALPVEIVSALLATGKITNCVSCGCILYLEQETAERVQTSGSKR